MFTPKLDYYGAISRAFTRARETQKPHYVVLLANGWAVFDNAELARFGGFEAIQYLPDGRQADVVISEHLERMAEEA